MKTFLASAMTLAVFLTVAQAGWASVPAVGPVIGPIVVANDDVPVWGPLRGHANPKCPRHTASDPIRSLPAPHRLPRTDNLLLIVNSNHL